MNNMSRIVRKSPYRHVFGTACKPDQLYADLRCNQAGDGSFIDTNGKFFAMPVEGNGGPVVVANLDAPKRYGHTALKVSVHKAKVLDVAWNPLNFTILATASEDCHFAVSQVPEDGMKENIHKPLCTLSGPMKKGTNLRWHPTASNILATGSADSQVRIYDITAQAEVLNFQDGQGGVHDIFWNANGSKMMAAFKDKKCRIFDPRDMKSVATFDGPCGIRKVSTRFANDGQIITAGSDGGHRCLWLWDERKLDSCLAKTEIDSSAGNLLVHYDPDNSIVYLAGRGDSSVKYYEVADGQFHKLSYFSSGSGTKGICWAPKVTLNASKCEIAKALRITGRDVETVSFVVPRKSDVFQDDIFPDTYGGVAAMTAEEYLSGKNAEPVMVSMQDAQLASSSAVEVGMSPAEMKAEIARLKGLLDNAGISY